MIRMATPKKKTSPEQIVATICEEALRGAAATMAAVRSTVKIDDLLALHQRLTGRPATPAEISDLEEKMGQKASPR
jgi:predicted house-cleaning NTP pyrophosphatase (Maf/HAM1 superfamily)